MLMGVYRGRFVAAETVARSGRRPGEYNVARLSVAALQGLGLNVTSAPVPGEIAGHAVIAELNTSTEPTRSKELQRELAKLASMSVVFVPRP